MKTNAGGAGVLSFAPALSEAGRGVAGRGALSEAELSLATFNSGLLVS